MVNKHIIIGNLGKDPELRAISNGKQVATFSVATSETYKDATGATQTQTQWHNIVVWDKLAELCGQYLQKGSKVYLEGKVTHREYDNKDGVKQWRTETVLSGPNAVVKFLDPPKTQGQPAQAANATAPATPSADDDLPF